MLVPSNNGGCTQATVDTVVNETYGVLISETLEVISVSTGEELDEDRVIDILVGTIHYPIYG